MRTSRSSRDQVLSIRCPAHEGDKPRLFEMLIGSKGLANVSFLHERKRNAIGEAPGLIWPVDEQLMASREEL